MADVLNQLSLQLIAWPVWSRVHELSKLLQHQEFKDLRTLRKFYESTLLISPTEMLVEIEQQCQIMSDALVATYADELLPLTLGDFHSPELKPERYHLNHSLRAQEAGAIQATVRRYFSPIFISAGDLNHLHARLKADLPVLVAMLDEHENPDRASAILKAVAAGTATAINPFAGVLAVIGIYNHDRERSKQGEQFFQRFSRTGTEYIDRWAELEDMHIKCIEQLRPLIEEKVQQVCVTAVTRVLDDLDAAGADLNHLPDAYGQFVAQLRVDFEIPRT
ncbi:MAG: hypothetical protein AB1705_07495 [Verrucomicrobiota bacterium]